jgi:hypothetical protein
MGAERSREGVRRGCSFIWPGRLLAKLPLGELAAWVCGKLCRYGSGPVACPTCGAVPAVLFYGGPRNSIRSPIVRRRQLRPASSSLVPTPGQPALHALSFLRNAISPINLCSSDPIDLLTAPPWCSSDPPPSGLRLRGLPDPPPGPPRCRRFSAQRDEATPLPVVRPRRSQATYHGKFYLFGQMCFRERDVYRVAELS